MMLGKRVLFILLPLIALGNGQSNAVRDWRFRRPSRFPPRVVPRPVYVARPTTFASRPEITTEVRPHETVSITHWPSSTYSPPIRGPSFNRRPNVVWSRPFIHSSSTPKPTVTVIVLPGSHSHALPTTPRPYYVYPEKPTPKPVNIPLAHESEPLYSKPESKPINEPEVSSSSRPITVASETENKPSVEPVSEAQVVSTLQPSPNSELVVSPVSEPQPEVTPGPQPEPHIIPETLVKPSPEPQAEPRPVPEEESRPQPVVEPKPELQIEPKPEPQIEPKPEPQTEPKPERQIEPKPEPESSPEPTPGATSELLPEGSLAVPVSSPAPEFEPVVSSSSKPVLEPESSSKPLFEPASVVPAGNSFMPDAPVPSESSRESSTPNAFSTAAEASPELELSDHSEVPSNPIRLKYIPGIGNSRNPISATWSKPSWFPKPSKKPEHPNPWKPTPKPIFYLPSRTSTVQVQPETTTSQKPVPVSVPMARKPSDTLDLMALMDYQCQEPNGYFAVPTECDAFVECKSNRARQINCPDGLHFNPKAVWPEYPCAYPSEVKCAAHYAKQAPKPTAECPRQYGYFPSPSGDCGEYIMCLEGKATKMSCPPGLAFNLKTTACDWPANVPSCNPDVFKGFTCPLPEIGENGKPSDVIYKYRYGKSCKKYIACQRGSPRLLSCDEGLSYDDASQSCMDDEFVKDCS